EQVEKIINEEVAKVRTEGVTDAEVKTAIAKISANVAYGRDGSFNIASGLNEDIAAGDWTLYVTLPDAVKKVTAADVKRVAGLYLNTNKRTPGWFVPIAAPAPAAK